MTEQGDQPVWSRIWHLGEINPALTLSVDDVIYHLGHLASRDLERGSGHRRLARVGRALARLTGGSLSHHRRRPSLRSRSARTPELISTRSSSLCLLPNGRSTAPLSNRRRLPSGTRTGRVIAVISPNMKQSCVLVICAGCTLLRKAYLGLFSDLGSELPPADRIGDWLGPKLQAAAIVGFEAVLHRPDLPTFEQVCRSYVESRRWHFVYPMIAGVAERLRTGRGVGDLPPDVTSTVLAALINEHLGDRISDRALIEALEATLRADPAHFERYVRLLIEPSLAQRIEHISGLYAFARSTPDQDLARRLAAEWLERYPDLPFGSRPSSPISCCAPAIARSCNDFIPPGSIGPVAPTSALAHGKRSHY